MIIVPKYKDIHGVIQGPTIGMGGEFRIVRYNCMGQINYDSGWETNLIVNNGLTIITTTSSWYSRTYIGSSATVALITDTTLGAFLAASAVGSAQPVVLDGAPNYTRKQTVVRRFDTGIGTGTIREVGIGNSTDGTSIFCRHVLSVPVTKAADEIIDAAWRFTIWPSLVDTIGSVVIDGITYDTITRIAGAGTNGNILLQYTAHAPFGVGTYPGELGTILQAPLGTKSVGNGTVSNLTGASGYRDLRATFSLDEGNASPGVRCGYMTTWPDLDMQTRFGAVGSDDPIPKDNTKVMTLDWRMSWARH